MIIKDNWQTAEGGVAAPLGFSACGIHAGLKKKNKDLALVYSQKPCTAGGCYTTNKVQAAPLKYNKQLITGQPAVQAIVINSGNANACTGEKGADDVRTMASVTAEVLNLQPEQIIVASTGVIGVHLPMQTVTEGIRTAAPLLSREGGNDAAAAILTTDLCSKQIAISLQLQEKTVTIGGMAKGSGMIHPNMATMLCFISTDAAVEKHALQQALSKAVDNTFNMITVDGDTSTNDMVAVLANGMAGTDLLTEEDDEYAEFAEALEYICCYLAQSIARDGEGATKLLEVRVKNALTLQDARTAARSIAGSNLVKTAVFGEDANWGRILVAAGYSGADFNPDCCDIYLGDEMAAKNGCALDFSEEHAKEILKKDKVVVTVDFNQGTAGATAWGCDLTYEYVRINGSYRT